MTSPPLANVLEYQSLLQLLPYLPTENFISKEDLDELLGCLGAVNSVDGLFPLLENLKGISSTLGHMRENIAWAEEIDGINQVMTTATLLLRHRRFFVEAIESLDKRPTQKQNSLFRPLIGSSPRYATMGFLPKNRSCLKQYYLLLSQFLVGYWTAKIKGASRELNSLEEGALEAIRAIADGTMQSALSRLPDAPCTPEDYLATLGSLPEEIRPTAYIRYLRQCLALRDHRTLKPGEYPPGIETGFEIPAGPTLLTGPTEPAIQILPAYEDVESPEDTHKPPPGIVYVFPPPSPENQLRRAALQAAKTRARENQMFRFERTDLNQHKLQILFEHLFPPEPPADIQDLQSHLQLGLMLLFGLDHNRLAGMGCFLGDHESPQEEGYLLSQRSFQLVSPGPVLKLALSAEAQNQAHSTEKFIHHAVPDFFQPLLARYIDLVAPTEAGSPLFGDSPHQILRNCSAVVSRLNRKYHLRLSLHQIQFCMERRVAALPGNDLAGASLALGKDIYLARTRVHYLSLDIESLQRFCQQTWCDMAREAGLVSTWTEPFPANETRHLGTPIRPKLQTVQTLVQTVKSFLHENRTLKTLEDLARYHNAYALYTALMITYSVAHRGTSTPFVAPGMLDRPTGFALVRDKDSPDFWHSRLVWLPPVCLRQLDYYHRHIERIRKLARDVPLAEGKEKYLFFLNNRGERETATRTRIEELLRHFGYHLPQNSPRHFLKSELQECGCAPEILEILLGHWNLGQEGWTQASGLHPHAYRQELEKHLPALLKRIGLVPLEGPGKLPPVELHLLPTREMRPRPTRRPTSAMDRFLGATPPSPVWFAVRGRIHAGRPATEAFPPQHKIALMMIHRLFPDLYHCSEQSWKIPPEKIQLLTARLKPRPFHPRHYFKRMTLLIDGLSWGKKHLGWEVDIPPRPILVPKGYNRVRPSLFRRLQTFRIVESAFLKQLELPPPPTPALRAGQIMLSACLYGGVNHPTWAGGLARGLSQHLYRHGELLWVDLWTDPAPAAEQEQWLAQRNPSKYRRWFPDPITTLLIERWLRQFPGERQGCGRWDTSTVVMAYLATIPGLDSALIGSFAALLTAGNAYSSLNMPPYLAAYAENSIHCTSLPVPAWLRLLTNRIIPTTPVPAGPRKTLSQTINRPMARPDQLRLFRSLTATLRADQKAASPKTQIRLLEGFLEEHDGQISPALELLTRWAIQLFSPRLYDRENRQKSPEATSTVENYLGAIGEEFLAAAGWVDILDLDPNDGQFPTIINAAARSLIEVRRDGSGELSQDRITYVLERLNQFLGFLSAFFSAPDTRVCTETGAASPKSKLTRSNLITASDYHGVLQRLGWGQSGLCRQEKMTLVATILLYRTGARIDEILGLTLQDVQGSTHMDLLIRRNDLRPLKTPASERNVPLHALLSPAEMELVHSWVQFRGAELGATRKCPIFTSGPMHSTPILERSLYGPLRQALREETGDPTMVLHHLRHSFATRMILELGNLDPEDPILSALGQAPAHGNTLKNEVSGRKSLYATSALLGHADTETTLASYFHMADYLVGTSLRKAITIDPPITAKALANLTGWSIPNAYKRLASGQLLPDTRIYPEIIDNRFSHPLLAHSQDKEILRPHSRPPSKPLLPYDVAMHLASHSSHRPDFASPPLTPWEEWVVRSLYAHALGLSPAEQRFCRRNAGLALVKYHPREKAIVTDSPRDARAILEFFRAIKLENGMQIRHHGNRWMPPEHNRKVLSKWREALGRKIGPGVRFYGRKKKGGCIRIFIREIQIEDCSIKCDTHTRNIVMFFIFSLSQEVSHHAHNSILSDH